MTRWRHLPAPARAIANTVTWAVDAAQARDPGAFDEAATQLAALEPERVGLVLGAVVRSLLEELHPDGLDGDDVRAVLDRCVRAAAEWQRDVDPHVVAMLLTGALGVHQEADDKAARPGPGQLARHAPLLVADLLAAARRPLAGYLATAFAEIERAETVESP